MCLLSSSPVTAPVTAVDVKAQDIPSLMLELPSISFAEQAITQAAYERPQNSTGNEVGLPNVRTRDNRLCKSEHFLGLLARYANKAFPEKADDERLVDSVLSSRPNI